MDTITHVGYHAREEMHDNGVRPGGAGVLHYGTDYLVISEYTHQTYGVDLEKPS